MKTLFLSAVAALVVSLAIAAGHVRGREAHAEIASATALPREAAQAPLDAAAEDRSEIVGQIEPMLVGSPQPRRAVPERAARR